MNRAVIDFYLEEFEKAPFTKEQLELALEFVLHEGILIGYSTNYDSALREEVEAALLIE